jgi:hypothetical protein
LEPPTQLPPENPSLPLFFQPSASMQLGGLRIVLDEKGWPRAAIAEGVAIDDHNRRVLYLGTEFEEPFALPTSKEGMEWLHLSKARHDLERARDMSLSGNGRLGANPPDFQILQTSPLAVELAQFTHSKRREALNQLRALKKAIVQEPPGRFAHLRDRLVVIGFGNPRGVPPKRTDQLGVNALLDRLEKTDPGPAPKSVPETVNPHGFQVFFKNSPLGSWEMACFPLPMLPHSALALACGFEIAAALTVVIRSSDTEAELARLTNEHDVAGNDLLLISAGAPCGPNGFPLICDEIAVEPEILSTIRLPTPKNLKRILLHRWSFGDVYELFPFRKNLVESEIVCGGPCVVPVGKVPALIINAKCPCGNGKFFRDCHGA